MVEVRYLLPERLGVVVVGWLVEMGMVINCTVGLGHDVIEFFNLDLLTGIGMYGTTACDIHLSRSRYWRCKSPVQAEKPLIRLLGQ